MNYKISVIVATYNSGDFLSEFLDSIKSQSLGFEDIEVIFVDDASTDDYTLDLLNNFNESYPNVSGHVDKIAINEGLILAITLLKSPLLYLP